MGILSQKRKVQKLHKTLKNMKHSLAMDPSSLSGSKKKQRSIVDPNVVDSEKAVEEYRITNPFTVAIQEWTLFLGWSRESKSNTEEAIQLLANQENPLPYPIYTRERLDVDLRRLQQQENPKGGELYCQSFFISVYFSRFTAEVWSELACRKQIWEIYLNEYAKAGQSVFSGHLIQGWHRDFPPVLVCKLFNEYFWPKIPNKSVLDLNPGTGGKLLGFWQTESCTSYIGVCNRSSPEWTCYENMIRKLAGKKKGQKHKRMVMIDEQQQQVDMGKFDILFASTSNVMEWRNLILPKYLPAMNSQCLIALHCYGTPGPVSTDCHILIGFETLPTIPLLLPNTSTEYCLRWSRTLKPAADF